MDVTINRARRLEHIGVCCTARRLAFSSSRASATETGRRRIGVAVSAPHAFDQLPLLVSQQRIQNRPCRTLNRLRDSLGGLVQQLPPAPPTHLAAL